MTTYHPDTPSKCPPKDASSSGETFYRIVFHDPPISDDFVIPVHEPWYRSELTKRQQAKDCRPFAMSIHSTESASRRAIKRYPHAFKTKAEVRGGNFLGVAKVRLDEQSGVMKQTGRDKEHYSLWPYVTSRLECNVIGVSEDVTS